LMGGLGQSLKLSFLGNVSPDLLLRVN
jgi:hypothetical protein